MNIFLLYLSIKKCAQAYFDVHLGKIGIEICQMLWTTHWVLDPEGTKTMDEDLREGKYKEWNGCTRTPTLKADRVTHRNHPMSKWVRAHKNNYLFAAKLAVSLFEEFSRRNKLINQNQGKKRIEQHLSEWKAHFLLERVPKGIPSFDIKSDPTKNPHSFLLPFPLCVPDEGCIRPGMRNVIELQARYNARYSVMTYQRFYRIHKMRKLIGYSYTPTPDFLYIESEKDYSRKVRRAKRRRDLERQERAQLKKKKQKITKNESDSEIIVS